MTNKQLIWDDARFFLAVARLGTLSAAANHLHIGIATLSRHIERLEYALGIPLFIRSLSGYRLTKDGLALIDKVESLEFAALAFSAVATARTEITGQIRLATAETLATEIIIPALPHLMQLYPHLKIEIITDIQIANLDQHDADLALRMVKPDRGNLSFQRIGTLGWGLYASEPYILQHPFNEVEEGLSGHSVISWDESQSTLFSAKWIESIASASCKILATSNLRTQLAAAKAGLGIEALPHYLGSSAGLQHIRQDMSLNQPIYLVVQSSLARSNRIKVMCNFLRNIMAEKQLFSK